MSLLREVAKDIRKYLGLPVEYSSVEGSIIHGIYTMECHSAKGQRLWRQKFPNLLTDVGVRHMMDHTLQTIVTPIVGPFLGLISASSFTAVANGDTMASHTGWLEAGDATPGPSFTGARQTAVFSVAAVRTKALSTPLSFAMTATSGTVQGAFVVTGATAAATLESTTGILFSAGAFVTPQPTVNGNTLSVSWSLAFT